jgi:hypothetical protein
MFFVMRRRGALPKLDVMEIARELTRFQTGDAPLKILLDWSELEAWPFEAPTLTATRAWKEGVPPISRAAIVHDPKWSRHAALLAALLRVCKAVVCSFLPSHHGDAIIWLEQNTIDEGLPYRGRAQGPERGSTSPTAFLRTPSDTRAQNVPCCRSRTRM